MVKLTDKHKNEQYYYVLVFSTFVKLGVTKSLEKRRVSNLRRFKDRGDAQYSLTFKISNEWDRKAIEDEWKLEFKEYNIGIECGSTRQETCYECFKSEYHAKYYSELLNFAKEHNFEVVDNDPNPSLDGESDEESDSDYELDEESEGESKYEPNEESEDDNDTEYRLPTSLKRTFVQSSRSNKRHKRN